MIQQSTAIVRARVKGASGLSAGADIYTVYGLDVIETLKAPNAVNTSPKAGVRPMKVAVPGGVAAGLRQVVTGAPILRPGAEYVVFLWTGKSGLTQIIGLSQGLFDVQRTPNQAPVVVRVAANDQMLDGKGHLVEPEPIAMKLGDLKGRVTKVLAGDAPLGTKIAGRRN
jgi:hypothetical protein